MLGTRKACVSMAGSGLSMNVARAAWQMLTDAVKTTLQ